MNDARRSYSSSLRDAQAGQTRERVLRAAAAEFAARGYLGTTLQTIADAAGVALGTVKLNGAKHELLLAAFELTFSGRESREQIMNDEGLRGALAGTPVEEWPELFADFALRFNAPAAALWATVTAAANADPAVRAPLADLLERRRADYALVIAALDDAGLIRRGDDRAELAATLSFLGSPEGYQQLVLESGLSQERYRAWIGDAIRRLVLGG